MTSELHAAGTPLPIDGYEAASRWAEKATFDPDDPTVGRDEVAAASGRALLQAAHVADEHAPTADDYEAAARWAETATWRKAQTGFGDGTHLVPEDVTPGTYQTTGTVKDYHWERNRGGDILANNFITGAGSAKVTVQRVTKRW